MVNNSLVLVEWADAHVADTGGWTTLTEFEDDGEALCWTVGWLVPLGEAGSKANHVTVWQTLDGQGDGFGAFCIPVGMVRSIRVVSPSAMPSENPVNS